MSWKNKAWAVAGTVTAVEVSKEKKLTRWGSAKHHQRQSVVTKTVSLGSSSLVSTQMERSSSSSCSSSSSFSSSTNCSKMASKRRVDRDEMRNQSEESLRTIMYLSCWGPY